MNTTFGQKYDEEDDFEEPEMANHKPVCYYVMNNALQEI
ncbi:hypothetical protein A2U01_0092047 [Trifolium medium]|uniref:Uncharacterized protein n=1 Tax=Trifolium medium TaxID=97028 RepID=A0A392UDJ4_9FABA|nr:hypothetical protein [Trifolium medium]